MQQDTLVSLAQILAAIRECVEKIKDAQKSNDVELFSQAKKEILQLQKKAREIL